MTNGSGFTAPQQSVLSKAVLVAALTAVVSKMEAMPENAKTTASKLGTAVEDINALIKGLETHLERGASLEDQYNKNLIEASLKQSRQEILQRFAHQPNISAAIDLVFMVVEKNLTFHANFSKLRMEAAIDDRAKSNPQHYDLSGNPKKPE